MQVFSLFLSASFYPTAIILLTFILSSAPWGLAQFTVKQCDAACHIQASLPPLCGLPCLQKLKVFFAINIFTRGCIYFFFRRNVLYICCNLYILHFLHTIPKTQTPGWLGNLRVCVCVCLCLCVLWGGRTLFCLSPSDCWHWLGGFRK